MESGRIEPLRALPAHREAQPCLQPPQCQIYTMYIDFPLDGNTLNPTSKVSAVTPTFSVTLAAAKGAGGPGGSYLKTFAGSLQPPN